MGGADENANSATVCTLHVVMSVLKTLFLFLWKKRQVVTAQIAASYTPSRLAAPLLDCNSTKRQQQEIMDRYHIMRRGGAQIFSRRCLDI